MAPFNRNIIVAADVETLLKPAAGVPRTLAEAPPAGAIPAAADPAAPDVAAPPVATTPAAGARTPTADDYLTRLLKYVPMEIVGAYLLVAGLVSSNVSDPDALQGWLGSLLAIGLVLTGVYVWRVLGVVRVAQAALSVVGFAAYVLAVGGWFATLTWYEPWHGTIGLVLFGVLVSVVKLNPLPTE